MLTTDQQEKAGELSLGLEWGHADLSEAIAWADAIIQDASIIDDDIFGISLAKEPYAAISYLNNISNTSDEWKVLRLFLKRFDGMTTLPFDRTSSLAKHLYMKCSYDKNAPADMACFSHHWDGIDLAVSGVLGDPNVAVSEFLADVKKFANGP